MLRLAIAALLAALAPAAVAAPSQAARAPVRVATETETHELAIAIKQPRWSCFSGRIARDGRWASLRRLPHAGCPGLPYAIAIRADARLGWKEARRFATRRGACASRRPRMSAPLKRGLYGCPR
ncbi:hypothetical protein [Conexibacter arvalis]|uniref:Uncharacterized protein n=1 Tax=Conexibacter arvalis TaxID=912552 RepID=A0A840IKV1_9ACTN|nr:hypothetical protein [Conexibacter arvalis]MBB4664644.1 hypothetical protein [Conexibacter arvalis]